MLIFSCSVVSCSLLSCSTKLGTNQSCSTLLLMSYNSLKSKRLHLNFFPATIVDKKNCVRFNKIACWVPSAIVSEKKLKLRVKIMSTFIKIAQVRYCVRVRVECVAGANFRCFFLFSCCSVCASWTTITWWWLWCLAWMLPRCCGSSGQERNSARKCKRYQPSTAVVTLRIH